jgi:chromosomal replication initiator protein
VELNPRFRFESFVIGPSNRLAATAAQTVAGTPGAAYNPLFIYGRSGLGKTHLLQAVGFAALERQPRLSVRYMTLEEFVDQYHAAVAAGQSDAFRMSAAETDILLLDDVQFLAKHREMQAELLRVSEALQAANRQLVLTSDRPPSEIEDLDERLISRLSGGLLVDLALPDFETRLAILRRKAGERSARFEAGVLESVAQIGASSVRELVGLVNRLVAFQAVSDTPLSAAGARALLVGEEETAAAQPSRAPAATSAPEATAPAGEAHGPAAAAQGSAPASFDEFGSFLSSVTRSVVQSMDAWRGPVNEAIKRWEGEGFRTARLQALLKEESLPGLQQELERFAADCEELKQLAAQVESLDPAAAGHARFRDPDQLEEARSWARKLSEGMAPPPAPSPALTFEDYVVGAANEPVVRASRLVAREPGKRYNPLFVAGPSGVGKSHLLNAIGNALVAEGAATRVACLSTATFIEDLLAAIAAGNVEWWRRRYRAADAFLLDDVQLIAGKDQTQDELFNLFNAFADAERQLVFTADRLPRHFEQVAPRLLTRFEGGLVVELAAPDRPMREALVRKLLGHHGVQGSDDVVEYLAARPADSARSVQGIVNRALSAMDAGDGELTLAAARTAVEGRASRPSQAQAISALIPAGIDPVLASREKMVWDWPEMGDRLFEELK